eukprot:scaffold43478_cov63-Phaeocystis_antarctica.AAC.3
MPEEEERVREWWVQGGVRQCPVTRHVTHPVTRYVTHRDSSARATHCAVEPCLANRVSPSSVALRRPAGRAVWSRMATVMVSYFFIRKGSESIRTSSAAMSTGPRTCAERAGGWNPEGLCGACAYAYV